MDSRKQIRNILLLLSLTLAFGCSQKPTSDRSLQSIDSKSPYFNALVITDGGDVANGGDSVVSDFDSNGNRTHQVVGNTENTYEYDVNGRLISQSVNPVGQSSTVVKTVSVYDADGNKIAFYSATQTITYIDSSARTIRRNSAAPVALLSGEGFESDEQGKTNYFVQDHLGSVVATVDASYGFKEVRDTLPFGQDWYSDKDAAFASADATDVTFNGNHKEGVPQMGAALIDYHARHLQSEMGRFIQADTVIPDAGAILSYNRYIYTSNNPVNRIDPDGHADMMAAHQPFIPSNRKIRTQKDTQRNAVTPKAYWQMLRGSASAAVGFIPTVGDAYDGGSAAIGYDIIAGQKLSASDRSITLAAGMLPFLPGVVARTLKHGDIVLKHVDEVVDISIDVQRAEGTMQSTIRLTTSLDVHGAPALVDEMGDVFENQKSISFLYNAKHGTFAQFMDHTQALPTHAEVGEALGWAGNPSVVGGTLIIEGEQSLLRLGNTSFLNEHLTMDHLSNISNQIEPKIPIHVQKIRAW